MIVTTNDSCKFCPVFIKYDENTSYDLVIDALMEISYKIAAKRKSGKIFVSGMICGIHTIDRQFKTKRLLSLYL